MPVFHLNKQQTGCARIKPFKFLCFSLLAIIIVVINSLHFVARKSWTRSINPAIVMENLNNVSSEEAISKSNTGDLVELRIPGPHEPKLAGPHPDQHSISNQNQAGDTEREPHKLGLVEKERRPPSFHAVTYASHTGSDDRFCMSMESAARQKIDLTILGWGVPWRGLFQKLEAAMSLAESMPPDDVILFVDAFDVLFTNASSQVAPSRTPARRTACAPDARLTAADPGKVRAHGRRPGLRGGVRLLAAHRPKPGARLLPQATPRRGAAQPSETAEPRVLIAFPSHSSESLIRVSRPSRLSGLGTRVTHPSRLSESEWLIRVAYPSVSRAGVSHPSPLGPPLGAGRWRG